MALSFVPTEAADVKRLAGDGLYCTFSGPMAWMVDF